ncbi:sodium/potassium-transporting ATPase subunit beta-1-interacting protein isoform X1 [Teleopsis dalmanni]|uniref:sodium/potassium-transporting ATPase subunit beta-1-interacting protein isoform X1 n=1 Tax=Teleopsis dalmanni TaxID=139649 RepID=UPI0018CD7876|nr:sodium/potassium-transporting ATPase subunit beta-1-interacting protein isoform X1 [Teleopsis dalmanni]XP_037951336.1 sodium/potassium-transporting ATPase subunit beta-1-interacting protein isoform X1 [Teleopsis dalmanni]
MGSCTRRHFLLSTCFLQMITIIERQVFDFLGYMWAPIFLNFFHIIFVIFGFYGAYHFRIKYIITYLIWNFLWIGWNSFLICFYLNVGILDRDSDLLNLGTGSVSWFEVNGYGCKPTYPTNITSDDPYRPIRPERVDECLLDYTIVEVIQSGVQCALAILGIFGAILISYIFLDEDDRFDFMNGDAKSPQHTVVHPMYVSYTSIPTSASATMLSNKHHHNHQQNSHHQQSNNNTFNLIHHTNSSNKKHSNNSSNNTPNSSKNNTLTRVLYNSKNNKIASSTTSILPAATAAATATVTNNAKLLQQYYDDSTAKADQLYTSSNRRQLATANATYQQHFVTPTSSHDNTVSSLSYASLQNSNFISANNLHSVYAAESPLSGRRGGGMGNSSIGGDAATEVGSCLTSSPLSNSNYSLTNSINNNNPVAGTSNSGRFARIHAKPRPPKSTSYSNFINSNGLPIGSGNNLHRPDIKYTQMSSERLSNNFDENFEDDNFSLRNFKTDGAVTYVPFQKPTPGNLFVNHNNNPSYTSLNSYTVNQNSLNNNVASPNNNSYAQETHPRDNSHIFLNDNEILLENGAKLHPVSIQEAAILEEKRRQLQLQQQYQAQTIFNPANHFMQQQNGLPFQPAYSPKPYRANSARPTRPTNIPLPTVPVHSFDIPISPSEVTPPPPPAPRPHIFQPRLGHAPYPDLSPEVTEKYAMPSQYIPRSPVATRVARRQRQQHERSQLANNSANFCDQIRNTQPTSHIVRAKSHDRLSNSQTAQAKANKEISAPHVNRRSGRREGGKARPRSYCNSMVGGEGVIRANIAVDREVSGVISSGLLTGNDRDIDHEV